MLTPYEILDHHREDLRRTLRAEGIAENEIEQAVERSLAHWIACSLSSAIICIAIAEREFFPHRADVSRQVWNW